MSLVKWPNIIIVYLSAYLIFINLEHISKNHIFFPNIQVIKSNIQLIFKYQGMGHEDSDASVIHLGGSLSVVQAYICIYFILTSTYCVENSYNFFININSFNTSRK